MKLLFAAITSFISTITLAQTKITFKDSAFYPEGVAYNKTTNDMYVGSVKTGTINKINAAGMASTLYKDASLKSSFGMKIDPTANLLWVCTGDPNYSIYKTPETFKKQARLIAIDLGKGTKVKDINIAALYNGDHFINDLTMDAAGNIFITDSYSPVIYKVDKQGTATVFAENAMFKGGDIGLNGIAWNDKGFLLTVNDANGCILKIDVATKAVTKVKVPQLFPGADGILLLNDKDLVLVQNKGVDKIFKLHSDDNWATAKVTGATISDDRFQNPSTATLKGNDVYILNAKLNEIEDPSKKPSEEFVIQMAQFKMP